MTQTQDFIEIIEKMIKKEVDVSFSLGRIDPKYNGGNPRILFDGETKLSIKRYPHLSTYKPQANDRVLLANLAGTHIVIGSIGQYRDQFSEGIKPLNLVNGARPMSGRTPEITKQGNIVTISGAISAQTGEVATLPYGFRPRTNQVFITALQTGASPPQTATLYVTSAGSVQVLTTTDGTKGVGLNCSFIADVDEG
jgi:hypothetical protein